MNTLRRSEPHHPSATLPLWTVWAVAPVVVALGIIGGMAAATYTGLGARPLSVAAAPTGTPDSPTTADGTSAAKGAGTSSPRPAASNASPPNTAVTGQMEVPPSTQTGPTPFTGTTATHPTPAAPAEVRDLRDAKAVLDDSFWLFSEGGISISPIQYQLMTNTGFSKSLVGMISVSSHEDWARAVKENPQRLKAWLEKAAARVRPAMEKEQVFLAWAVVEVRKDRPTGFADNEIKPLSDGTYLVTRPLAATIDPGQPTVSLRPAPVKGAAAPSGPWATYGPQIRFDSSDMYRPLGADGKQLH